MAIVAYILGDCPGCGSKDAFGNIDVYKTQVLRGCRRCDYKERVPLPPVTKEILYLDQFFLSHAFRGSDARFVQAAEQIEKLAAKQLLVVPYSSVHEEETHQWERHAELFRFIKATARGHQFLPAHDVERNQLAKAFDGWLRGKSSSYVRHEDDVFRDQEIHSWDGYYWIDVGGYFGDRDLIRSLKAKSTQDLIALFEAWPKSERTFEEDLLAEHRDAARGYLQAYLAYVQRVSERDFSALFNSPVMSMVVERLLDQLPNTTSQEQRFTKVMEFFQSEHFQRSPKQDLSARIYATLKARVKAGAYSNRDKALERLSGFFNDVSHVATYAPYCDAFVVDQTMADLLARPTVAIQERYGVKIFSLNNWPAMLIWLSQLETKMPDEHKRALSLAYPRSP